MSLAAGGRLLRHHLRPQRTALLQVAAWSALEAVPTFLSGLLVANAVDRGFVAHRPLVGFGWLGALALLWVTGAIGTRQVYPRLAVTVEPLRDSLVTAVVTATLRRALNGQEDAGGSSVVQATVQVETVRALFSSLLRNTRQLLSAAIAAIGGLAVLSPLLALVVAGFVVLAVVCFAGLLRFLVVRQRAVVLRAERVGSVAAPVVEGMRDIVAAGAERRAAAEVGEAIDSEAQALRAYARTSVLRVPLVLVGADLPLLALLALSPWLVAHHQLTVGEIVGGVVYIFTGLQPAIGVLVNAGGTILVNLGVVLSRLAEVSAAPPAPPASAAALLPADHDLSVHGVTFAYSPHAEPVVRDLTLHVPEEMHLAVVGPSGVGKSTLANLLARLVTPQRGGLWLGGVGLDQVDEQHLRRTVALIPQEAYVFAGTVRDNLTYLYPGASGSEVERAAAAVGLGETVSRLGGYDAEVPPGGGTLSAGERQLIALARVYLSPAQVVILDEATCHLDPVAEARAEQAFAERPGTLIVIAHRISSAMRAHQILVMDGADAVLGKHGDLLASNRLYADLVGYWRRCGEPAPLAAAAQAEPVAVGGPARRPVVLAHGTGTQGGSRTGLAPRPTPRGPAPHSLTPGSPVGPPSRDRGASVPPGPLPRRRAVASFPPPGADNATGTDGGTVHPAGSVIFGQITVSDGTPLGAATVTLTDLDGRQLDHGRTNRSGHYRLATAPGIYLVVCASESYQSRAALVTVGQRPIRYDVVLAGAGVLAGMVRASVPAGRALAGVTVTLTDAQGAVIASTVTAADGGYRFTELPGSRYTVTALASGFQPLAAAVAVAATGDTTQDLELAGLARLIGRVHSTNGRQPVGEAVATLVDDAGTVVASATTDARGGFVFDDLPEGSYTITATSYLPASTPVQLAAGGPTRVEIALSPPSPEGAPARTNGSGDAADNPCAASGIHDHDDPLAK